MRRIIALIITLTFLLNINPISLGAATPERVLGGSIEGINYRENSISLLDYDGKGHTFKIPSLAPIVIEGVNRGIYDLYYGQEVDIILEGDLVKKVIAYPEEDPERAGYIMPGSRFKYGEVLFLSPNSIEIKVKDKREKYRLSSDTDIIKNGQSISINQVKAGDKVVLHFDDIYSTQVSTLRVQDEEKHISGILRGQIHSVDEKRKEVHLKYPYIYKEGIGWTRYPEYIVKLKIDSDQLYNGGNKLTLRELNRFINKEAYVAFHSGFGRLNIAKLQIKNGSSRMYKAPIEDIEYGSQRMVVDKNIIHFHPGTIVVKGNRLVDVLNIDRANDVFVNTDIIRGLAVANLVSIEGTSILDERIDGSRLVIYRGKIEDISQYEVSIGRINYRLDYLKLKDKHKWTEEKDSQSFQLTEDTLIYDSQLQKYIPASYFISSRYINLNDIKDITLRNRLRDNFYKNKTAYFVVRESPFGKELLALNITPHISQYRHNIHMDYSTIGEIAEIDYDGNTITFTKVQNFNTLNNRWESTSDELVDISSSVILLNDIPIPEDKLYTLRKGSKGYIIKNKRSSLDAGYVIILED